MSKAVVDVSMLWLREYPAHCAPLDQQGGLVVSLSSQDDWVQGLLMCLIDHYALHASQALLSMTLRGG
jgi:hypothetical protein